MSEEAFNPMAWLDSQSSVPSTGYGVKAELPSVSLDFMNGSPVKDIQDPGIFGDFGLSDGLNAVNSLGKLWIGLETLGLAKDQFKFSTQATKNNWAGQANNINNYRAGVQDNILANRANRGLDNRHLLTGDQLIAETGINPNWDQATTRGYQSLPIESQTAAPTQTTNRRPLDYGPRARA